MAMDTLTDEARAILELESQRWDTVGGKEEAISRQLNLSPARYYQLLNQLLDTQAALAAHPVMVNRLRRIRGSRSVRRR